MHVQIETEKLGSRRRVIYIWCSWLTVTIAFVYSMIFAPTPIFFWLAFPIIWAFVTLQLANFSYGEVSQGGLRYRRLWGWKEVRWSEIDSFYRDWITGGIYVTLLWAPKFMRKLYFSDRFVGRYNRTQRVAMVERFNAICKECQLDSDS
jgi:hypothetical protein